MRKYKFSNLPKKKKKLSKQGKAIQKILSGKRVKRTAQKGGFFGINYFTHKLLGLKPPENNSLYQALGR